MDIVKKNIVSIVCGVVAILCVVLVFYPFNGMYRSLEADVDKSSATGDQIVRIRHEQRTWPTLDANELTHVALTKFPTQSTIDAGSKLTQSWTQEATDFRDSVIAYQVGKMQPLVPNALPGVPGQLSTAYHFADEYKKMFALHPRDEKTGEPGAVLGVLKGQLPPTEAEITARTDEVVAYIKATKPSTVGANVINQPEVDAAVEKAKEETPDEMRQKVAFKSVVYLDPLFAVTPEARIPANANTAPSVNDIFVAQVGLWVQQEFCRAIVETNAGAKRGVLDAPIKRLLAIRPSVPFAAVALPAGQPLGEPLKPPALPQAKLVPDYVRNPLGQTSNDLYDVIPCSVSIICEADSMPATLTSLVRNRFIMIRGMDVLSTDSAIAYAQGYIYGNKPVVQLNLRCQYLMLRPFLAPFMPQDIIRGLNAVGQPQPQ